MSDNHPAEPVWPLDGPPRDPSSTPALKNNLQWLALVVPVVVAAMIYLCLRIRNMRRQHKRSSENEQADQDGWLVPSSARRHASSSSCLVPSIPPSQQSTRRLPLVRFSDPLLQQPSAVHYHQRPTQCRTTHHHGRRHHRRRTRRSRPRTPPPAYPGSSSPPPPPYDDIIVPMDDSRDNEPLAHLQNALLSHHQHYASSVAVRSS